jgi:hypothetical protein
MKNEATNKETTMTTTIDPKAIDTRVAAIWTETSTIVRDVKYTQDYLDNPKGYFRTPSDVKAAEARIETLIARRVVLEAEIAPLNALYRAHRWSRFFLVTNDNGHVHSSMACSTTFPTTKWAWLPELSGKTERDAVAEYGEKMCTICFPSAPAIAREIGPSRSAREAAAAKATKDAAKAQRAEAARAKLLFDDGRSVRIGHDSLRSIYDAKTALKSACEYAFVAKFRAEKADGADRIAFFQKELENQTTAKAIVAILAPRLGLDADEMLTIAIAKANKEVNKWHR